MASVFRISCPACGYSTGATVGNGTRVLCTCPDCRAVINPATIPFRFDPPLCPHCATPVSPGDGWPQSCPKCDAKLDYEERMHMMLYAPDRYPAVGTRVHLAREHPAERRRWLIHQLWLGHGEVVVFDVPDRFPSWQYDAPRPVFEAEVIGIDQTPEGHVTHLYLRFLREEPSLTLAPA